MANYTQPIKGAMGKTWKISSKMGWRVHPVLKELTLLALEKILLRF
jgi:murein DD-endopeptidase MepM/ murein hydrolase activator NlpD